MRNFAKLGTKTALTSVHLRRRVGQQEVQYVGLTLRKAVKMVEAAISTSEDKQGQWWMTVEASEMVVQGRTMREPTTDTVQYQASRSSSV